MTEKSREILSRIITEMKMIIDNERTADKRDINAWMTSLKSVFDFCQNTLWITRDISVNITHNENCFPSAYLNISLMGSKDVDSIINQKVLKKEIAELLSEYTTKK